jgi:coenzyme F420-reducing hydrogenase gamma subunit
VAAPEVVAGAAMAACSCCDTASTATTHSREAATAAWTVAMAATKSDGAMPEAVDVIAMVSGSVGSGIAMTKAGVEVDRSGLKLRIRAGSGLVG